MCNNTSLHIKNQFASLQLYDVHIPSIFVIGTFFGLHLKKNSKVMNYCSSLMPSLRIRSCCSIATFIEIMQNQTWLASWCMQKMNNSAQYMIISTCFFLDPILYYCTKVWRQMSCLSLLTNLNLMGVCLNFTQGQFHWNVV